MGALSRTFRGAVLVPVLLLLTSLSMGFAQQKALRIDELAKQAEVVAVGRITDLKSEWTDGQSQIITRVTLAVDEYLKGGRDAASVVTIVTLGGEIGEVGELYTHVPSFRPNENVVVFLEKTDVAEFVVTGGTQGKYNIERDPRTGRAIVAGQQPLEDFTAAVRRAAQR